MQTAAPELTDARRRIVLILAMLVLFLHLIDRQIMAILAEPMKADLGFSDTHIGLLTGLGFSIFYSVLGIPLARLAVRFDRVYILSASAGLWSAMTAVTGLMSSFGTVLASRIGVAVGEAGGIPPLHSLIADLFPEEKRARAFSIMQLGGPLGVLAAFFGGGFLVTAIGWRAVFFVAGGLGLLLVPFLLMFLPEPRRYVPVQKRDRLPFFQSVSELFAHRAFFHMVAGVTFAGMGLYATIIWTPAFLIRSFGLPVEQVGLVLGLAFGVLGAIAVVLVGSAADRARRYDVAAHSMAPAVLMVVAAPLALLSLMSSTLTIAMVCLVLPIMGMSSWQAPATAAVQQVATPKTRALAAALFMFFLNLLGLGLGPLVVGILSDMLAPRFGQESLRYALIVVPVAFFISAAFWLVAAREVRRYSAQGDIRKLATT